MLRLLCRGGLIGSAVTISAIEGTSEETLTQTIVNSGIEYSLGEYGSILDISYDEVRWESHFEFDGTGTVQVLHLHFDDTTSYNVPDMNDSGLIVDTNISGLIVDSDVDDIYVTFDNSVIATDSYFNLKIDFLP